MTKSRKQEVTVWKSLVSFKFTAKRTVCALFMWKKLHEALTIIWSIPIQQDKWASDGKDFNGLISHILDNYNYTQKHSLFIKAKVYLLHLFLWIFVVKASLCGLKALYLNCFSFKLTSLYCKSKRLTKKKAYISF